MLREQILVMMFRNFDVCSVLLISSPERFSKVILNGANELIMSFEIIARGSAFSMIFLWEREVVYSGPFFEASQ